MRRLLEVVAVFLLASVAVQAQTGLEPTEVSEAAPALVAEAVSGEAASTEQVRVDEFEDVAAQEQAKGRRDPFRPFVNLRGPQEKENEVPLVGLRAYSLQQLKLVAVIWELEPPRAILQDSAGMGYVVTPGMAVGNEGGVIAAIEPGRLIVEGKSQDFYGQIQIKREVLELIREEGPRRGERK